MKLPLKQIWFCGGGTQSCTVAALIIDGRLPKPDLAVIADTGRECGSTWEYLDRVLNPAVSAIGLTIERVAAFLGRVTLRLVSLNNPFSI